MPLRARGTGGDLGVKTRRAGVAGMLCARVVGVDLRAGVSNDHVDP